MDMVTGEQVYWLTRCDALKAALDCDGGFILLALCGAILFAIFTFGCMTSSEDVARNKENVEENKYRLQCSEFELKCCKFAKKLSLCLLAVFLPLWLFCRVTHPFVPTTKEMAAIVVIPRVANSESVQGLGEGIVDLAKDWMQELRPANVKAAAKAAAAVAKEAAKEVKSAANEVKSAAKGAKAAVDDTAQKVKAAAAEAKGAVQ